MTKKNIGKSKEDNTLFKVVTVLVVLFLVFFIAGYVLKSHSTSKYDFTKQNNYWIAHLTFNGKPYTIPFYYKPNEVKDIKYDSGAVDPILQIDKQTGILLISVDPETPAYMAVAGTQISRITGNRYQVLNIPTKAAYYSDPGYNITDPIADCSIAGPNRVVIHLTTGTENSITSDGYCITLTAKDKDGALKAADRFVYELLKMM